MAAIRRAAILKLATQEMDSARARDWADSSADERVQRAIALNEVWVAEQGKSAVGWVEIDGNRVEGLYVRPDFAGRGIGSALLLRAGDRIRSAGHDAVALDASPNAESFYLHRGYQAQTDRPAEAGRPMRKPLATENPR